MQLSIKFLSTQFCNTQKNKAFTVVAHILSDHANSCHTVIRAVRLRKELDNEDGITLV